MFPFHARGVKTQDPGSPGTVEKMLKGGGVRMEMDQDLAVFSWMN